MFSTRDQENLVHARQTTAAAKPLNQGIRSLQPKTPANFKTPFRPARHDENNPANFQKTIRKNEAGKGSHQSFITPAGPQQRAPLGAKTANTKAHAIRTPGFECTINQGKTTKKSSTGRRSVRKLTIAQPDSAQSSTVENTIEEEEPEFGYAPPPIVELPDPPMDFGYDGNYPELRPENLTRGYGEIFFGSPTDDDGFSLRVKREEEEYARFQEAQVKEYEERMQALESSQADPDAIVDAMIAAGPKQGQKLRAGESKISTVRARAAAAALSEPGRKLPSAVTKQTASSIQKQSKVGPLPTRMNKPTTYQSSRPAPAAVSKNTIGFPKAKKAPSIIPHANQSKGPRVEAACTPATRDQNKIHPLEFVELYGEPPADSEMWFRLRQHELIEKDSSDLFAEQDDLADDLSDMEFFSPFTEDEKDFQLPVPEE